MEPLTLETAAFAAFAGIYVFIWFKTFVWGRMT
jgi:hypothetical protein